MADECGWQWITNWPVGPGGKWGTCSPEFAAQVLWDGQCDAMLVEKTTPVSRHILRVPDWARPRTLGMPMSRALVTAMRISPLDRHREARRAA